MGNVGMQAPAVSAASKPDVVKPEAPGLLKVHARYPSIDIARGIIMILMAIDHASKFWNAGKAKGIEGAIGLPPINYGDWTQQLTREITHICAPGFELLAGMGLGIFVWLRVV